MSTTFTAGDKVRHESGTTGIVEKIVEVEEGTFELYVNVNGSAGYWDPADTEHIA